VSVVGGNSIFSGIDGAFTLPFTWNRQRDRACRTHRFGRAREQPSGQHTRAGTDCYSAYAFVDFLFNSTPTEFNTAQVNGLIHTQIVYDFVKSINPNYPGVDIQIPCNVNINNTCNAYYSNRTINFYRAGGGCVNTCYSTVVYHEYGHFIIHDGAPECQRRLP
jgi:hypothetical protein